MGSVYRRKGSPFWWMWLLDVRGKRVYASTGTDDEKKARTMLSRLERQVEAQRAAGVTPETGPLTLFRYGEAWLARRRASGVASVGNEEGYWEHHVKGHDMAKLPLADVRPGHLRDFIAEVAKKPSRKGGTLAPRTVNHVYSFLRVLFSDAVAEELLAVSPCVLKARRKELPRKRDKDATWRGGAVFTHAEVEALISDARISEDRRVLYACLFLGGMRFGELADRKWSDYEPKAKPLGRLSIGSSLSAITKASKETKTGATRLVPVHPTLARMLARWWLQGWAAMRGHAPSDADWLIPSPSGVRRSVSPALKVFRKDCAALGLRPRRLHDARRSFVSLALADGARPELLRWVSHDPPADQFNQYLSPPWHTLCQEVSRLAITQHEEAPVTLELQTVAETKNPAKSEDLAGRMQRGIQDSKPSPLAHGVSPRSAERGDAAGYAVTTRIERQDVAAECNSVTQVEEGAE